MQARDYNNRIKEIVESLNAGKDKDQFLILLEFEMDSIRELARIDGVFLKEDTLRELHAFRNLVEAKLEESFSKNPPVEVVEAVKAMIENINVIINKTRDACSEMIRQLEEKDNLSKQEDAMKSYLQRLLNVFNELDKEDQRLKEQQAQQVSPKSAPLSRKTSNGKTPTVSGSASRIFSGSISGQGKKTQTKEQSVDTKKLRIERSLEELRDKPMSDGLQEQLNRVTRSYSNIGMFEEKKSAQEQLQRVENDLAKLQKSIADESKSKKDKGKNLFERITHTLTHPATVESVGKYLRAANESFKLLDKDDRRALANVKVGLERRQRQLDDLAGQKDGSHKRSELSRLQREIKDYHLQIEGRSKRITYESVRHDLLVATESFDMLDGGSKRFLANVEVSLERREKQLAALEKKKDTPHKRSELSRLQREIKDYYSQIDNRLKGPRKGHSMG